MTRLRTQSIEDEDLEVNAAKSAFGEESVSKRHTDRNHCERPPESSERVSER